MRRVEDPAHPKRLSITVNIEVDVETPAALKAYKGLALMIREILTPEEQRRFLDELEEHREKIAKIAPGAPDAVKDTIRTRGRIGRKRKTPGGGE